LELAIFLIVITGIVAAALYFVARRRPSHASTVPATNQESSYQVSYIAPEFQWSGTTSGALPIKILTYKQYECLEDARYGFRIVAVPPAERKLPQPHKTRAHGLKTVSSLLKHGFLDPDSDGGYVISDHGLNALEVCTVRY
jgi:hypothetical protein